MKVGDKVNAIDNSCTMTIKNGICEHKDEVGGYAQNRNPHKIIVLNCRLPIDPHSPQKNVINDTIIQPLNHPDEIIFIREEYLRLYEDNRIKEIIEKKKVSLDKYERLLDTLIKAKNILEEPCTYCDIYLKNQNCPLIKDDICKSCLSVSQSQYSNLYQNLYNLIDGETRIIQNAIEQDIENDKQKIDS